MKMSPPSVHYSIDSCQAVNKNFLLAFHSVCHILDRDKTTSLGNKMLLKAITRHKLWNDHKLAVH